jgi:hypothetical protein
MSVKIIKLAAQIYETRDTMRALLGADYIETISPFVPKLEAEMKRTGKSVMSACVSIAGGMANENARLVLVACAAEMAEPDPAFPLPTFTNKPMISKDTQEPGDTVATKPATELKKERRHVACILTQDERNEHASNLAKSLRDKARLEDQKKAAAKQFDAKIAEVEATINKESNIVATGEEFRDILCEWHLDTPKKGKKTLKRTDAAFVGTDVVEVYDMDGADVQKTITFEKGGLS